MARWSQIAHVAHGAVAGFLWWLDWRVSLFLFLQFSLYEFFEESKIKDEMYHELKEWAMGFVIALLIVLLLLLLIPSPTTQYWIGGGDKRFNFPRLMSF